MMVVIVSGIVLTVIYLVAEYLGWRKHLTNRKRLAEGFRALQAEPPANRPRRP